jgi:shikimate kinase
VTGAPTAEPGNRPDLRRIVLVGFMASGKSSVGPLLARALDWDFADVDACVEAEEGRSVARIFAEAGEERFREAEERVAARLLARDGIVVAAGGGWGAAPGRLRSLPEGTTSVWLRVSAEEAVRRCGIEGGGRPLLRVPDPLEAARELLQRRAPRYARAHLRVDTECRTVEDVARQILTLLGIAPGGFAMAERQ